MKFKIDQNIPLPLAVWLAVDEYAHSSDPNTISATALLKPTKAIVLQKLLVASGAKPEPVNLSSMIASRMGTALHNSIEWAWRNKYKEALKDLGYPEQAIEQFALDPVKPTEGIDVHIEKRTTRSIAGFNVTGAFDFCMDGRVVDFKSTSVWSWIFDTNGVKHSQQGSIYRWLNPEIIKDDYVDINYIFTDYSNSAAKQNKDYPPSRVLSQKYKLMSLEQTETFITKKLNEITRYLDAKSQNELPLCTDEELWRKETVYKYYKNPAKTSRSTKNFTSMAEATERHANDGGVGLVKEVKGQVVACKYCPCVNNCNQAEAYLADGILELL